MTKLFINLKKKKKKTIFGPFSPFWGQIFFQKIWLYHADPHMGPKHHLKFQKKLSQFQENYLKDRRMNGP